jgi:hypothetical protein
VFGDIVDSFGRAVEGRGESDLVFERVNYSHAPQDCRLAKRTHFGSAGSPQIHVLIGFSGKIAIYGDAQNYQNMKIIAAWDQEV